MKLSSDFFENFVLGQYIDSPNVKKKYKHDFLEVLDEADRIMDSSCFEEVSNEHDANKCLDFYNELYKEATKNLDSVKNGSPIYRGLRINPRNYRQFTLDLKESEGNTLDYWMYGVPKKYLPLRAGKYWTWDSDHANLEGRESDTRDVDDVVLVAVKPKKIDEWNTVIKNIVFEGKEKEILLENNSEVYLKKICHWKSGFKRCDSYNDWIDVGNIERADSYQRFK